MGWKSKNRHKYLLQCHLIFVCKYRKKFFLNSTIFEKVKQLSFEICNKHKGNIEEMETDKDHIHYMIEYEPTISISKIVNLMKSYITFHIWNTESNYLKNYLWKEKTFFTDGYFVCSIGNVSKEQLQKYIENQG
jgi:putative transposase